MLHLRAGLAPALLFAFLAVKAWGEGDNGYGPTRALESFART